MQLGALVPFTDTGGEPSVVRDFAQTSRSDGLRFPGGPGPCARRQSRQRTPAPTSAAAVADDMFHDPFVLLGYLSAATTKLQFSTGVLIVAQRQTALVAKQAACLDVLSGGRFRLGIGVGWNPVEFTGLNENFHNRGRRSEEQAQVMQALWAQPT